MTGAVVDVLGEELRDPGRVVADERDDQGEGVAHRDLRPAKADEVNAYRLVWADLEQRALDDAAPRKTINEAM